MSSSVEIKWGTDAAEEEAVETVEEEQISLSPLPDLAGISEDLNFLIGAGLPADHGVYGQQDLGFGNGAYFLTDCVQCKDYLIAYLNDNKDNIISSLGQEAWDELAPLYINYTDGWALYVDFRLTKQPDFAHTVGLCVGKGDYGFGINCWSQEWSVDEQRYTNPNAYWFRSVVIDKSRTSPDLTAAEPLNCGDGDPMLGCWSLD